MKRIKNILLGVVFAPLIILAVMLSLPFILIMETKAAISLRIFRRRKSGYVYLICTSKRNWHDFLKNNVIPILPENVRAVWQKSVRDGEYPDLIAHLARSRVFGVSKPYMVAVTPRAFLHQSLNTPLQKLKSNPKKSEETRKACSEIITQTLKELRTKQWRLKNAPHF